MSGLRSGGRKHSFDVLTTSASFFDDDGAFFQTSSPGSPVDTKEDASTTKTKRRKRRNKASKKKKEKDEDYGNCNNVTSGSNHSRLETITTEVVYGEVVVPPEKESVGTVISSERGTAELRQMSSNVASGGGNLPKVFIGEDVKECIGSSCVSTGASSAEIGTELLMKRRDEMNVNRHVVRNKEESLDLKQGIAIEKPNHKFCVEILPVKYFMEEMHGGYSLRTTTSLADEKERERVYDTIFHMPWRCALAVQNHFGSRAV